MYQAVAYQRRNNTVHIWDDVKGHVKIKYKPYAYAKNPSGVLTPELAQNEVTAIAIYDEAGDQKHVWILDKDRKVASTKKGNFETTSCQDEATLLSKFLLKYYEIQPTLITGWNIDFFDIPYLYNRICHVLGESQARTLSPIKDVIWLKHRNRYRISGVSCLEYE